MKLEIIVGAVLIFVFLLIYIALVLPKKAEPSEKLMEAPLSETSKNTNSSEKQNKKINESVFQNRINQLIKSKMNEGYTIQTICHDIPVSPSTLYEWRMGEAFPNRKSMERAARYFGVSVQWLCSREAEREYYSLLEDKDNKA